jgi:hypothetical protein
MNVLSEWSVWNGLYVYFLPHFFLFTACVSFVMILGAGILCVLRSGILLASLLMGVLVCACSSPSKKFCNELVSPPSSKVSMFFSSSFLKSSSSFFCSTIFSLFSVSFCFSSSSISLFSSSVYFTPVLSSEESPPAKRHFLNTCSFDVLFAFSLRSRSFGQTFCFASSKTYIRLIILSR